MRRFILRVSIKVLMWTGIGLHVARLSDWLRVQLILEFTGSATWTLGSTITRRHSLAILPQQETTR